MNLSPLPVSGLAAPQPATTGPLPHFPSELPDSPPPTRRPELRPMGETRRQPVAAAPRPIPPLMQERPAAEAEPQPDFTDSDLAAALEPLIPRTGAGIPWENDLVDFEASLRATVRRALAEHSRGPFDRPDFAQRCLWRFDALVSSRSYEEIVHDKTHRFRVEEVFLFDHNHLSLISFASADPARHAVARKIHPTADRLAQQICDTSGALALDFPFERGTRALIRTGRHTILAALVRGTPDAFVKSDLEYALKRIERHFTREFETGEPLLQEIQPLLEECLLIHSPIAPVDA